MSASQRMRAVAGVAAALLLYAATALAADAELQGNLQKVLAPAGALRAALYPGTPTSIVDPKESEPRGVGYELGKALAQRLGVPYEPVVYAKNADVLAAMKAGTAVDVAFTNASAARQKDMDFGGRPYLLIELGFLAPAGSPITSPDLAAIDHKGRRIGVAAGSTSQSSLTRDLKNAEVVPAATNLNGAELVAAGKIDAFATNKATLFELAERVPGVKVLPGRWGEERHGIAIPKGREQGLPFIKAFTEDALAQGLVKAAMDRAGLKGAQAAE
jgi:polar amino acid transport system substrate-binding protein